MFKYNIEYRKNILFFRLEGILNINTINNLNTELDILVNKLGIKNIVFNFENLDYIDIYSINTLNRWYNVIQSRKGVSLICGVHAYGNRNNIFKNIKEIENELSAIRVIDWIN